MEKGSSYKNHGIYRFDQESEYYCGIKVISQEEQVSYIKTAFDVAVRDKKLAALHIANYNKYEVEPGVFVYGKRAEIERTKPKGYCKTHRANHGIRHSITPFTSYNCTDCLARYLVELRASSPGVTIRCSVLGKSMESVAKAVKVIDISNIKSISVKLIRDVCELRIGDEVVTVRDFVLRAGTPPMLEMKECYTKLTTYIGECNASLLGIPICASLLFGRECLGSTIRPANSFTICSVPISYPGWDEIVDIPDLGDKKNYKGKLWIHFQCKACREHEPILDLPVQHDETKRSTQSRLEDGDLRDRMIRDLLLENNTQFEEIRKLRAIIVDLTLRLSSEDL